MPSEPAMARRRARYAVAWLGLSFSLAACSQLLGIEDTRTQGTCFSNAECAPHYECSLGVCRLGCSSDAECAGAEQCRAGLCDSSNAAKVGVGGAAGVGGTASGTGATAGLVGASGSPSPSGGGLGGSEAGIGESGGAGGESPGECPSVSDQGYEGRLFLENQGDIVQAIHPFFQLASTSSSNVELRRVKLRYYFTSEGSGSVTTECFWVTGGACADALLSVVELTPSTASATHVLEVSFPDASTTFGLEDLEVRVGLHYGNQNLRQSNDYSFDAAPNVAAANEFPYRNWSRVTAYVDDEQVWGREPCSSD